MTAPISHRRLVIRAATSMSRTDTLRRLLKEPGILKARPLSRHAAWALHAAMPGRVSDDRPDGMTGHAAWVHCPNGPLFSPNLGIL